MRPDDLFKNLSPDVTEAMIDLANGGWLGLRFVTHQLLVRAGRHDEGREVLEKALAGAKDRASQLSEGSQEWRDGWWLVRSYLVDLASLVRDQDAFEETDSLLVQSRDILSKLRGSDPNHPEKAEELNQWGSLLEAKGDYSGAETLYRQALAIRTMMFTPDHPAVARVSNNLANALCSQRKFPEAESLYKSSLATRKKILGPEHEAVAIALNNYARMLMGVKRYDEALELLDDSIASRLNTKGDEHPAMVNVLTTKSEIFRLQKRDDDALPWAMRALELAKKTVPDSKLTAVTHNNVALVFRAKEQSEAAEHYRVAITIGEKSPELREHPDLAVWYFNLARMLGMQANYRDAQPFYENALAIQERSLGRDHPGTIRTRGWTADTYEKLRLLDKAEPLWREVFESKQRVCGEHHKDVAWALKCWANVLVKQR
ncbi:unnamed protein product [Ectocarpus sp. CCAP 1310/34]|nr:unnamed protein product [Ectocarpus sp. CCAP 1310/34]